MHYILLLVLYYFTTLPHDVLGRGDDVTDSPSPQVAALQAELGEARAEQRKTAATLERKEMERSKVGAAHIQRFLLQGQSIVLYHGL